MKLKQRKSRKLNKFNWKLFYVALIIIGTIVTGYLTVRNNPTINFIGGDKQGGVYEAPAKTQIPDKPQAPAPMAVSGSDTLRDIQIKIDEAAEEEVKNNPGLTAAQVSKQIVDDINSGESPIILSTLITSYDSEGKPKKDANAAAEEKLAEIAQKATKEVLTQANSQTGNDQPESERMICSNGKGVSYPAGVFVPTGYGWANNARSSSGGDQRECVKIEDDCTHGEVQACDVVYAANPANVILPTKAGKEYTGKDDGSYKNNCIDKSGAISVTGSQQGSDRCFDGRWVGETEFDTNMKDTCVNAQYDPITNKCGPPSTNTPPVVDIFAQKEAARAADAVARSVGYVDTSKTYKDNKACLEAIKGKTGYQCQPMPIGSDFYVSRAGVKLEACPMPDGGSQLVDSKKGCAAIPGSVSALAFRNTKNANSSLTGGEPTTNPNNCRFGGSPSTAGDALDSGYICHDYTGKVPAESTTTNPDSDSESSTLLPGSATTDDDANCQFGGTMVTGGQYRCYCDASQTSWLNCGQNSSNENLPTGAECAGGGNNDPSCSSGECKRGIKPGTTTTNWYCMAETNVNSVDIKTPEGKVLKANGSWCQGNNSVCASGFCEINTGFLIFGMIDRCADNPFIDPSQAISGKNRAQQQIENNQNKYELIIAKDPKALVESETSLGLCEKEHGENTESEINCVQVPGRPLVYVPKEDINDLMNDLKLELPGKESSLNISDNPAALANPPAQVSLVITPGAPSSQNSTLNDTSDPDIGISIAQAAAAKLATCSVGWNNSYNACEGEYYQGDILESSQGVPTTFKEDPVDIYDMYWCTQLVFDAADAAGVVVPPDERIYKASKLHEDFTAEGSLIPIDNAVYTGPNQNIAEGNVAFVEFPSASGEYSVSHVAIVKEIYSTDSGSVYVDLYQSNAPDTIITYELTDNGELATVQNETTYYIAGFGDMEEYAKQKNY